jgi:hypothetical protein
MVVGEELRMEAEELGEWGEREEGGGGGGAELVLAVPVAPVVAAPVLRPGDCDVSPMRLRPRYFGGEGREVVEVEVEVEVGIEGG